MKCQKVILRLIQKVIEESYIQEHFTDLLTGIRKMNEEIDTTVRGVDDASGTGFLQVPQTLQKRHSL